MENVSPQDRRCRVELDYRFNLKCKFFEKVHHKIILEFTVF